MDALNRHPHSITVYEESAVLVHDVFTRPTSVFPQCARYDPAGLVCPATLSKLPRVQSVNQPNTSGLQLGSVSALVFYTRNARFCMKNADTVMRLPP